MFTLLQKYPINCTDNIRHAREEKVGKFFIDNIRPLVA